MVISTPESTGAVISYCHADRRHLERLKVHLTPFVRDKKVDYWVDTMIIPGSDWFQDIERAFASARVAILLVSADFLASKFIAENELPPLLAAAKQKKAVILSVILSPCAIEHTEMSRYQTINPISKPLSSMNKHGKESIWAAVAVQVRDALNY
jgi:hypothetical protein